MLELFKATVEKLLEEQKEKRVAYENRLHAKAELHNGRKDGVIFDCNGRFHAPYDGFKWESELTGECIYGAGQFLPGDPGDEAMFGVLDKSKEPPIVPLIAEAHEWLKQVAYGEICTEKTNRKSMKIGGCEFFFYRLWCRSGAVQIVREQASAMVNAAKAKEKEGAGEAPEGRVAVVADIVSTKVVDDGFYEPSVKALFRLENRATAWGTLPRGLSITDRCKVEFKATFERSKDDSTHAFFKRPLLVRVIDQAA